MAAMQLPSHVLYITYTNDGYVAFRGNANHHEHHTYATIEELVQVIDRHPGAIIADVHTRAALAECGITVEGRTRPAEA